MITYTKNGKIVAFGLTLYHPIYLRDGSPTGKPTGLAVVRELEDLAKNGPSFFVPYSSDRTAAAIPPEQLDELVAGKDFDMPEPEYNDLEWDKYYVLPENPDDAFVLVDDLVNLNDIERRRMESASLQTRREELLAAASASTDDRISTLVHQVDAVVGVMYDDAMAAQKKCEQLTAEASAFLDEAENFNNDPSAAAYRKRHEKSIRRQTFSMFMSGLCAGAAVTLLFDFRN